MSDEPMTVQTDEEWDEALKNLSDDEMLDYMRHFYKTMSENLDAYPGITVEMLEALRAKGDVFEESVKRSKISDHEAAIAQAKMEASADRYLKAIDDHDRQTLSPDAMKKKKGN